MFRNLAHLIGEIIVDLIKSRLAIGGMGKKFVILSILMKIMEVPASI